MAEENASRIAELSKQKEVAENDDYLLQLEQRRAKLRTTVAPTEAPSAPVAPSAPEAPQPTQTGPAPEAGSIDETGAPIPTEEPQIAPVPQEPQREFYDTVDTGKSLGRAIPAFIGDIADNGLEHLSTAAEYLNLSEGFLKGTPLEAAAALVEGGFDRESGVRSAVDDTLGTPETSVGQFAQDVAPEIVAMIPIYRGIKTSWWLGRLALTAVAEGGLVGASLRPDENTVAGSIGEAMGMEPGMFSNKPEDSLLERQMRAGIEGAAFAGAADAAFTAVAKRASTFISNRKLARDLISDSPDEVFDNVVEEIAQTQASKQMELKVLKETRRTMDDIAEGMDDAAEQAKFLGLEEVTDADGVTRLQTTLDQKINKLEEEIAINEAALAKAVDESPMTGEGIENIRQDLNEGELISPEINGVLGKEADVRISVAEPTVLPARRAVGKNNHLELDEADAAAFHIAMRNGNADEAASAIARSFDNTNLNKIADTGDVHEELTALAGEYGALPASERSKIKKTLEGMLEEGEDELAAVAKEAGKDPQAMAEILEAQFPGQDLDATLTAYRLFELALLKRADKLADDIAAGAAGPAEELLMKTAILMANVNDRRSGLVTNIARALASLKNEIAPPGMHILLDAGRAGRKAATENSVASLGGSKAAKELAETIIVHRNNPKLALRAINKAYDRQANSWNTVANAWVASGMLTSPTTHIDNQFGPMFRLLIADPIAETVGGVARVVFTGNPAQLRQAVHHIRANYAALANLVGVDSLVRQIRKGAPDAHLTPAQEARTGARQRANIAEAARTGSRVTAPAGGAEKFAVPGQGNAIRAAELARTIARRRPNSPMAKALAGRADGTERLWGVPKDPESDVKLRHGLTAAGLDWLGRAQSWTSRHLMSTMDQVTTGISYTAKLEADVYREAAERGLTGIQAQSWIDDMILNAPNVQQVVNNLDRTDPLQIARANDLAAMNTSASNYGQELTFTSTPGPKTQEMLNALNARPVTKWFTFFARTAADILRVSSNAMAPVNAYKAAKHGLAGETDQAFSEVGKLVVNGGILMSAGSLYHSGRLTGSGPTNAAQRKVWEDEGKQPYSFYLDGKNGEPGKWVSYARYAPFSLQIMVMAEILDGFAYADDVTAGAQMKELLTRGGRLLDSQWYLAGITDLLGIMAGRVSPEATGTSILPAFVPQAALFRNVARNGAFTDVPKERHIKDKGQGYEYNENGTLVPRTEGFVLGSFGAAVGDKLNQDLPVDLEGWNDLLETLHLEKSTRQEYPTRDIFGEPMHYPEGFGPNNFTGIHASTEHTSPVMKELSAQKVGFNPNTKFATVPGGIETTPQQQDWIHRRFAKPGHGSPTIEERLQRVMDSSAYKDYKSDQLANSDLTHGRRKMLEAELNRVADAAREAAYSEFPALRKARDLKRERARMAESQEGTAELELEQEARKSPLLKLLE